MLTTVDTMEALARMNQGEREERSFSDVVVLKGYRFEVDSAGKPKSLQTLEINVSEYLAPGTAMVPPLPHALELKTKAGDTFAVVFPTSMRLWPGEAAGEIGRLQVVAHRIFDGPIRFTMEGQAWSPSAS